MKRLADLIYEQRITGESDLQIIYRYLRENDLEEEGMKIIVDLSQSKLSKVTSTLNNARTWIPTLPDMYEGNRKRIPRDIVKQFERIVHYYLLDCELPESLVKWAETTIPQMSTPVVIFIPMVQWLKDKYHIEFNDHKV